MSSMISETSWLPLASCSAISLSTFATCEPSCWLAAPKVSPIWSVIRPPTLYWSLEAAFSRLTSVLPSRLARTRLSSSATFSNSARRSRCLFTASSSFSSAGVSGGGVFESCGLPIKVVTASR